MKIKPETEEFLSKNLHKTRAEYYIGLFSSMSPEGFANMIKKYCYLTPESQRTYFLGKLDDDSTLLLITREIIRKRISYKKNKLLDYEKISIHASERELEKARDEYSKQQDQIDKASEDCWKVRKKLYLDIQNYFSQELSLLIKSSNLIKKEANFQHGIPGYDFEFFGKDIYVVNWHPTGGD